jgi:antitoxin (DNA-binding transcriptional repressor) of toxin-antitoxin stability system
MTTIDASKLPANAVKALVSGEEAKLTRAGRAIAVLHATSARFRVSAARAKHLLRQIREADQTDDWSDYVAWDLK